MDALSSGLNTFLVRLGLQPDSLPHEAAHFTEHLLHLLEPADEEAVIGYYGLFGAEQLSLDELARSRSLSPEDMMESIDLSLRRLAITPEWQVIRRMAAAR